MATFPNGRSVLDQEARDAIAAETAAREGNVATLQAAVAAEQSARSAADAALLPKSGGTLTGALTLAGDPTNPLHAATRQYVLALVASKQDASTAATDAELTAATNALTAALALKQDSASAATDSELAAAVNTLNATLAGKATPADVTNAVATEAVARDAAILSAINALKAGAPGALDTLNEIATQLANDESVVAALTSTVAGKLTAASNLSDLANAATARDNLGLGTAATQAATAFDPAGAAAAAQAASQPLDDDLTAVAAIATTPFGRALLALADATAGRSALDLGTAATHAHGDYDLAGAAAAVAAAAQPLDDDLTAIAALTTAGFGRALLTLGDAAAVRGAIGAPSSTDAPPAPKLRPGYYYGPSGGQSALAATANQLLAVPFYLGATKTFDRIAAEITSAGAGGTPTVRLGIYSNRADYDYPDALVLDAGTVAATATGLAAITINQQLQPGLYWLVLAAQGATTTQPSVRAVAGFSDRIGMTTPAGVDSLMAYTVAGVTGALPATFPATPQTGPNRAMRVLLRST